MSRQHYLTWRCARGYIGDRMPQIEPFYADLGRRIQQLRNSKKMTQTELGELLSPPMTRASVANIESGKQRVLVHTLIDLVQTLGCTLTDLVPYQVTPAASAISPQTVAAELQQKLGLPKQKIATITQQMIKQRRLS